MASSAKIDVTQAWALIQAGPFAGKITNLSGNLVVLTVTSSTPAPFSPGVPIGTAGISFQLQTGENLYARAYHTPSSVQIDTDLVQVVTFPLNLQTDEGGTYARLRVDPAQTGFFAGREFRFVRKLISPIVFRLTCPVPIIVFDQTFTLSEGDVELYTWAGTNVTPAGTWTNLPINRENTFNTAYTGQTTVASGGTITPIDANNYRDYARLLVANATAQRSTVGAVPFTERYLAAGTYYAQFTGTGQGSYSLMWEERP